MTILDAQHLQALHCSPAKDALDGEEARRLAALLPHWRLENGKLVREFRFADYYETLAFVNALAYVTHAEDHHPELTVTYNRCVARYDTHSVNQGQGGLSLNDFICAAKADALAERA
ncbi:pterin-4-alpha-carbinolamine dehydratase [Massilia sp. Root351]|jgi:4a-hydroxytetrahydrobiopterin dehydratase|uniref:4a-hydroxytetrahydrobiopterin dehydratase n=1 Tax=Massilia sp. Root351 TaxID=1736522 RepID=UPI00070C2A17|nr:4a-hydroxytetrahydrobiopterin dehydratase [Massilia sp. Root351]KQV85861.1 pterin-4-alpha-carbinolamine dehydratase [Massilia sp. Root351]